MSNYIKTETVICKVCKKPYQKRLKKRRGANGFGKGGTRGINTVTCSSECSKMRSRTISRNNARFISIRTGINKHTIELYLKGEWNVPEQIKQKIHHIMEMEV